MNDVHRLLFWLSKEEIENYFEEINVALQNCGYEPLKKLQYQEQGIFSDEDFLSLEDDNAISTGTAPSSIMRARSLPLARLEIATMHR